MATWNRKAVLPAAFVLLASALAAISSNRAIAQTGTTETNPASNPSVPLSLTTAVRWDVLLNDDGMPSIDQIDRQAVETTSRGYQASICDAAALRSGVMAAIGAAGMEGADENMGFSRSQGEGRLLMNPPLYFDYYDLPNQKIGIQGSANGDEQLEITPDGQLHLKLAYKSVSTRIYDRTTRKQVPAEKTKPSINYNGLLSPGKSLMFLGTLHNGNASYYHLIVWEAFKSDPRYDNNFGMIRAADVWCAFRTG